MYRVIDWLSVIGFFAICQSGIAQEKDIARAHVKLEQRKAADGPICIPLNISADYANVTDVSSDLAWNQGLPLVNNVLGTLTRPSLLTEKSIPEVKGLIRRDLHILRPPADSFDITIRPPQADARPAPSFTWQPRPGEFADLLFDNTPILRYVHAPYNNSSPTNRDKTYKVFHHLFDPTGQRFLTNGGDTNDPLPRNPKDLLYPHHRGLFFAYNQITFDGNKKCDTWHAKPGDTHQSHQGFILQEAGTVLGRHRVAVDWHGPKKEVFANEERDITVYKMDKGTLVEFASRLKTTGGPVKLSGDPHHAGFQFRAHNDVHEQKMDKQTYYLRPDGKGKLGETRNWDPKTKKGPINLPWDACSFIIDKKRYTVAYFNHPNNPGESRWSERDYGRFGCYFEYELTKDKPLVINYRVWLQEGEMSVEEVDSLSRAFTKPPKVTLK